MKFNFSLGFKNRSQRKTKRRPSAACNTTVATMACIYTGNKFTVPDGVLPEDHLMDILDSTEGRKVLNSYSPGAKCNPWNVSYCIAWAVNKAAGKKICTVEEASLQDMVFHILQGGIVGIGGGFVKGGTSGHFVAVVGVETDQNIDEINVSDDVDITKIKTIIMDDPWGDYTSQYKNHDGNDVTLPVENFLSLTFGKSKVKTMQMYYPSEAA
jgi:hypothetical protein